MSREVPPGPHSAAFLAHVTSPRGQGRLERATHRGHAVDDACGDRLELDVRVERGVIADVRFRVEGCPGAIAVGSVLTTLLPGRGASRDALTAHEIEDALGGLPPSKRHVLRLALQAIAATVGDAGTT